MFAAIKHNSFQLTQATVYTDQYVNDALSLHLTYLLNLYYSNNGIFNT